MEKKSNWSNIPAGVPQGSVFCPLIFLVYINDLTNNMSSQMRLFAVDSSLFTSVGGVEPRMLSGITNGK